VPLKSIPDRTFGHGNVTVGGCWLRLDTMNPQSQATNTALPKANRWAVAGAYLALTKPRVIELLLITTIPVMVLAQKGLPSLWLVLSTLIGGAMSAGSANAFNCVIDADIDKVMGRTKNRPLVTGALSTRQAIVFSTLLGLTSVLWLGLRVNWLSAGLALSAELFYIFVYTLLLKRRTSQNIVWGGAAGAMPVLIGFSAVTNSISWSAAVLFLIIFLWTPPHYWPLSIKYRDDYQAAGVPMLPVVANPNRVALEIVIYSYAMVASTLLLIPIQPMGVIYTAAAVLGGIWFIFEAHVLQNKTKQAISNNPMRLFHISISYLTILFIAVGVDPLVYVKIF